MFSHGSLIMDLCFISFAVEQIKLISTALHFLVQIDGLQFQVTKEQYIYFVWMKIIQYMPEVLGQVVAILDFH